MIFVLSQGFPRKGKKKFEESGKTLSILSLCCALMIRTLFQVVGSRLNKCELYTRGNVLGRGEELWAKVRLTKHVSSPFCGCLKSTKNFWCWFRISSLKKIKLSLATFFSEKKPINQCLLKTLPRQFPAAAANQITLPLLNSKLRDISRDKIWLRRN